RDRRGVRGRATDAALLERLDEARLGEARRRGRLVPVRGDLARRERVALGHAREAGLTLGALGTRGVLGVALDVAPLFVGGEEASEGDLGARRREDGLSALPRERRVRTQADRRGRAPRVRHLRRDRALPDEVVELELVARELTRDLLRGTERVPRRTDRLVRLLGTLRLRRVQPGRVGDRVVTVELGRLAPRGRDRLRAERRRVGAHIGDV